MNCLATLEDWLEETDLAVAHEYKSVLLKLGASSETFRPEQPDIQANETKRILCEAGIPQLAANDIFHSATRFFAKQCALSNLPLAVFWDAENVLIPGNLTGTDCHANIKSTLSVFGRLNMINVYLDVNGNCIPFDKRSQLQLSGCTIIDTPHIGSGTNRKEVADKMILVDAMLYVLNHLETGATLCFITADTDFAYLMSKIERLQKFQTILVYNRRATVHQVNVLDRAATHLISWADVHGSRVHHIGQESDAQRVVPQAVVATSNGLIQSADTCLATNSNLVIMPTPSAAQSLVGSTSKHKSESSFVSPSAVASSRNAQCGIEGMDANPSSPTSQLVVPSESGAKLEQSSSGGEDIDAVTILLSILERLEAEHCRARFQRRVVGSVLKKLNPFLVFSRVVEQAVAQCVVRIGREQGHGWIERVK